MICLNPRKMVKLDSALLFKAKKRYILSGKRIKHFITHDVSKNLDMQTIYYIMFFKE